MNKEEIESLFKKYKVRIPKEKQGQSECHECKRHHKYSLTWTSFLYEYKENYYCFEHIAIILLQRENEKLKDNWNKLRKWLKEYEEGTYGLGSYETGLSDGLGDVIKKMQELQGSDD